jgi:Fe-S oxidoreductase
MASAEPLDIAPKGDQSPATGAGSGHSSLESLSHLAVKCPRCSLCKFPPLSAVESQRFSSICPSIDHYGFHSHSGGGRVLMANSLLAGRAEITPQARDTIFQCTMCGGCDTSCKYVSDIEVSEIMDGLRASSFETVGPLGAHAEILQNLERNGHPYPTGSKGDWLLDAPGVRVGQSERILLVGSAYALVPGRRRTLLALVELLDAASVAFSVLGSEEPDCGTMALHLGDRARFDRLAGDAIDALNRSGALEIVCADAEDYATLRAHFPKVGELRPRVRHAVELLDEEVAHGRLKLRFPVAGRVAYHDPCSLGRRSEPHRQWTGREFKNEDQLLVYDPPRPVNRGDGGCYDPPRRLLAAIPELQLIELPRRREYSYCCGASGGVPEAFPEMAQNAAHERLAEADSTGAEILATACPGCEAHLGAIAGESESDSERPRVAGIYDLLARALRGPGKEGETDV